MAYEVTENTIHRNAWKSIYTIINDSKITDTVVYAGFPNKQPHFPCYVLQPVDVDARSITLGSIQDYDFSIDIELWVLARKDRKEKIDEMKDNLLSTFLTYLTELGNQNLTLAEDWYEDNSSETVEINDEKFHTGSVTLKFKFLK